MIWIICQENRDPAVQEAFKKELMPWLYEAIIANKRDVFFVDAAHFVLALFLGFLWWFSRLFIRAPAGRQRYDVLGALNVVTNNPHDALKIVLKP